MAQERVYIRKEDSKSTKHALSETERSHYVAVWPDFWQKILKISKFFKIFSKFLLDFEAQLADSLRKPELRETEVDRPGE
jgi:hypothetical protein